MNTPHKWAEVIKAWADGAAVEFRSIDASDGGKWWDAKDYGVDVGPAPKLQGL